MFGRSFRIKIGMNHLVSLYRQYAWNTIWHYMIPGCWRIAIAASYQMIDMVSVAVRKQFPKIVILRRQMWGYCHQKKTDYVSQNVLTLCVFLFLFCLPRSLCSDFILVKSKFKSILEAAFWRNDSCTAGGVICLLRIRIGSGSWGTLRKNNVSRNNTSTTHTKKSSNRKQKAVQYHLNVLLAPICQY